MACLFKKRILCVNDCRDDGDLLSFAFEPRLYEIQIAQTLADGLWLARDYLFDLYVFDLALPDGNGLDLFEEVRSFDFLTPIILHSNNTLESTKRLAVQVGTQAFFSKPVDFNLLVTTATWLLESNSTVATALNRPITPPPVLRSLFLYKCNSGCCSLMPLDDPENPEEMD
jgi:DNA-binding response OmpR family regulator